MSDGRIKEHEVLRKQEKQQDIMEGKEIRKLAQLYAWELSKIEELKKQEKYNNKITHMVSLNYFFLSQGVQLHTVPELWKTYYHSRHYINLGYFLLSCVIPKGLFGEN